MERDKSQMEKALKCGDEDWGEGQGDKWVWEYVEMGKALKCGDDEIGEDREVISTGEAWNYDMYIEERKAFSKNKHGNI